MASHRSPPVPRQLRERQDQLARALRSLSGAPYELVKLRSDWSALGEPFVEFTHQVRIREAGVLFFVREEFRDIDTIPHLHAFQYCLAREEDVTVASPLFRYECHPFDRDPPSDDEDTAFQNPYGTIPHFHPDRTLEIDTVKGLHYPFNRAERTAIVFALIEWIKVDLIRRHYSRN